MNELGAKTILICSNTSNLAVGGIDRAADDFNELGEIAKVRDIFIGYEALPWGKYILDHRDAWEIVRRANHKHVGIILDSFHTLSKGINLDTITSIPKEKIFFVVILKMIKIYQKLKIINIYILVTLVLKKKDFL